MDMENITLEQMRSLFQKLPRDSILFQLDLMDAYRGKNFETLKPFNVSKVSLGTNVTRHSLEADGKAWRVDVIVTYENGKVVSEIVKVWQYRMSDFRYECILERRINFNEVENPV